MTCGIDVSRSTVWRTLRRAGYTMKKVHVLFYPLPLIVLMYSRLHGLQQNDLHRSASNILQRLASTSQSSLFSWTSHLWIGEQHIEVGHGLSVEQKPSERLFSFAGVGMSSPTYKNYLADVLAVLDSLFFPLFRFVMELSILILLKVHSVRKLSIVSLKAFWTTCNLFRRQILLSLWIIVVFTSIQKSRSLSFRGELSRNLHCL